MEILRITRQIHCKAVEQRATLIHRQYNRDWGTSYSRPPIDLYTSLPPLQNPGGATGFKRDGAVGHRSLTVGGDECCLLLQQTTVATAVRRPADVPATCPLCTSSTQPRGPPGSPAGPYTDTCSETFGRQSHARSDLRPVLASKEGILQCLTGSHR